MKKLFKDYVAAIAGAGLGRGLSFATTLLLARMMGARGFGIFSLFFTILMLIWQLPFFMDTIYVRYVQVESKKNAKEYMKITFFIKLIVLFCLLIAAYPISRFISSSIFHKPEIALSIAIALGSGAFLSVFTTLASVYQAQERFHLYSLMNILFYASVFLVIVVIVLLRIPLTPKIAVCVYGCTTFVLGICGMWYLYRKTKPPLPLHVPYLIEMGQFGKWLVAETVLVIIWQRLDILFLARITGYEDLGLYSAAIRIGMIATIMTGAATAIFLPRGCRSLKSSGILKEYFRESSSVILFLSAGIFLLILITPVLVNLLLGAEYSACVTAARILLLDAFFLLLYTPFSFLFYAKADTKKIFLFTLSRLIITLIALQIFVPLMGLEGAALSIALSSCAVFIMSVCASRKIIVRPQQFPLCEQIAEEV